MNLPFDLRTLWERALARYNGYSPRDRRIILGVLVALGLSIVYVGVVEPILDYRKAVGREIGDGQFELERAMRFVGAKNTLRAEREDLRKRLTQAKSRLLPGGSGTLGAAALQERANALASEKGITVQSTQVMKEEAADPFRKVAVRLTLSGELKPFAELVSALEYQQQLGIPFVEVSRRGVVAGAKGPRTLSISVEVSGFVQGGVPGKAEAAEGDAAAATDGAGAPAEAAAATGDGAATGDAAGAPEAQGEAPAPPVDAAGPPAPANGDTGAPPSSAPPPTVLPGIPTTVPAPNAASVVSTTIVPITLPTMVIPTATVPTTAPPRPSPAPPRTGGPDQDDDEDGD